MNTNHLRVTRLTHEQGNETFDRFKEGDRVKEKIGQGRMHVDTVSASMAAKQIKPGREGVVLSVVMRRTGRKPTASMRTYVQVKWTAPELILAWCESSRKNQYADRRSEL